MEMPRNESAGPVWVKCSPSSVLSVGLESALRKLRARVHRGLFPPMDVPSVVVYVPESGDDAASGVQDLKAVAPDAAIVAFGASADLALARAAFQAGARGFAHADMPPEQITRVLEVVREGGEALPRVLLRHWVDERRSLDPAVLLSPRQRETLELLAEGLSNAQIARRLYLSESTVKQHLSGVYKALGVKDRNQAASLLRRKWAP